MSADAALRRWRRFLAIWYIASPLGAVVFAAILWAVFGGSFGTALTLSVFCGLPFQAVLPSLYLQIVRREPTSPQFVARAEARVSTFHWWLGRGVLLATGLTVLAMGLL